MNVEIWQQCLRSIAPFLFTSRKMAARVLKLSSSLVKLSTNSVLLKVLTHSTALYQFSVYHFWEYMLEENLATIRLSRLRTLAVPLTDYSSNLYQSFR